MQISKEMFVVPSKLLKFLHSQHNAVCWEHKTKASVEGTAMLGAGGSQKVISKLPVHTAVFIQGGG